MLARLQLGDVHYFLGQMEAAEGAVKGVPKQAVILNRAMERVKAHQLLAAAQAQLGRFPDAEASLREATEQARSLGVRYLIAGCAFVRAVIDLTNGILHPESVDELEAARVRYEKEGDGLSTADCLAELAIYHHRLGSEDSLVIDKNLSKAATLYNEIAGAKLGQVNVQVYVAEIRIDRGELICAKDHAGSEPIDRMSSAYEAMKEARRIASVPGLPEGIKKDVAVWASLLNLFLGERYQIATGEFESACVAPKQDTILHPGFVLRERNRAFRELLKNPTPSNLDSLKRLAEQARSFQFGYNEAITRTLAALGCIRLNRNDQCDSEIDRIEQLVNNGRLGWSIWGQVHNVQELGQPLGRDWAKAAATLLNLAVKRGILRKPACWSKEKT